MSRLAAAVPPRTIDRVALAALVGGAMVIAFAPILVRLSQVGPTATAFWRLALAVPLLGMWLTLQPNPARGRQTGRPGSYRWLIAAGLFFAGDLTIWHWAIKFTTVANATLLANFAPVFVTLGGWLLFRQKTSPVFVLGMATALAGATMLVRASFSLSLQHFTGDLLGMLTAMFYAGYILSVKQARDNFSTATIMTWSGLVAAAALYPVTLLSGEGFLAASWQGWLVLLGLAWLVHAGGQGLIAFALAHLPAAFSSVTLLIQPVMAAVLAWAILSEAIGPWQAAGGVVVLAGIFVARQGSRAG